MTFLNEAAASIRYPDHFFIDGKWVKPSSTDVIDVVDSDSEEVFLTVAEAKASDMSTAVAAAREAFDEGPWPRMSHAERAEILMAFAAGLRIRSEDLSRAWSRESGALYSISQFMPEGAAQTFEFYASLARTFPFEERHEPTKGAASYLFREPVGVVGAIIPWNAPLFLASYKLAPAFLAGCTTVLKCSPEAPAEGYVLAEVAESVGLPRGVLNVVTSDRDVSELLVRDPRVDKIAFTGSTAAGRRIASICGERIARVSLELGGKSAAVILDDYDLEQAAQTLSAAECSVAGQVCASLTRIVVSRSRHDEFVEALAATFSNVRVGNPFDSTSQMGPLVSELHRERVEGYINKGKDEATLVTGGSRPSHLDRGYYVEPTVFANVESSAVIAQNEIFGPVLSVIPAENEKDALRIANDTIYGLNAMVLTKDPDRAREVGRNLRSGTVGHNQWRSSYGVAFGGFKQSGLGREGGVEGLRSYLETKTVFIEES